MFTNTTYIAVAEIPAAFSAVSALIVSAFEAAQVKPANHRGSAAGMTDVDFGWVRHPRGIPL
ncbi:hypothetical protein ACSMXN_10115 [Jatrophihabitans sp. DSM 45814]